MSTSVRIYLQGEVQYVAIVLELLDFCLSLLVGVHASRRPSRHPSITSRLLHLFHTSSCCNLSTSVVPPALIV
jgi:hypothetical protein